MPSLKIKICGVTTPEDAAATCEAGADAIGLNFYAKSSRFIEPRQAATLIRAIPPLVSTVGVFVDQPIRQMTAIAFQLGLRAVQHHGEITRIEDSFPFSLIPAFRVRDLPDLAQIHQQLQQWRSVGIVPGAILLDSFVPGQHGGTGQVAPWELLADFRPGVPVILAGGLTPENVARAIQIVRPAAVDVASGVESSPGKKDPHLLREFVLRAREAAEKP